MSEDVVKCRSVGRNLHTRKAGIGPKSTKWLEHPGNQFLEEIWKIPSKIIALDKDAKRNIPEVPVGFARPVRNRRFKIFRGDTAEKYGPSEDCKACEVPMAEDPVAKNHTEACRDRLAQEMMARGDSRVLRDFDRMVENRHWVLQKYKDVTGMR